MRIEYVLRKRNISGEMDNPTFLLANGVGSFLSLSSKGEFSRYQGLHFCAPSGDGWEINKIIESITVPDHEPEALINHLKWVKRTYKGGGEESFFLAERNGFLYHVSGITGRITLRLDMRGIHDFSTEGREHKAAQEGDLTVFECRSGLFLAIKGARFEVKGEWQERHYPLEARRGSNPSDWFVFCAGDMLVDAETHIGFGYGKTREEAVENAEYIHFHPNRIEENNLSHLFDMCAGVPDLWNSYMEIAYFAARHSLNSLITEIGGRRGIFAGLPWFFQFWTRDEAISCGALINLSRGSDARNFLMRELESILPNGRLANRQPHSELGSADGMGWAYFRLQQLLRMGLAYRNLGNLFTKQDLITIKERLRFSIVKTMDLYLKDGLIINYPKETWMDTDDGRDPRDGARIEIQALFLSMLRLMRMLLHPVRNRREIASFRSTERMIRKAVKDRFYDGKSLADGLVEGRADMTQRPNIFLAYYIYPWLLVPSQWKTAFDSALGALWLDWGGLASIDRKDVRFCPSHTGQDDRSYHRGDSWFFVNNIAAIAMFRLDRERFKDRILGILNSSTDDILFAGFCGHHSEISSAGEFEPLGCFAQAWSAATFIELVDELAR